MSVFGVALVRISIFSPKAGKCGKNADQSNSEYGYFLCSDSYVTRMYLYVIRMPLVCGFTLNAFPQFFSEHFGRVDLIRKNYIHLWRPQRGSGWIANFWAILQMVADRFWEGDIFTLGTSTYTKKQIFLFHHDY